MAITLSSTPPATVGSPSGGERTLTPPLAAHYRHMSHRLAKSNRLSNVLVVLLRDPANGAVTREALEEAPMAFVFKVAREAGVNLNYAIRDSTWRFAVGRAWRLTHRGDT